MPRPQSPLEHAYVQRRADLVRFFRLRLKSTEAAEDLVQDMFLRISDVTDREINNPAAYLYRLGWNMMLDRLRQEKRSTTRDDDWARVQHTMQAQEAIVDAPSAEEALVSRDRLQRLLVALEDLSPTTRRVFRLHKLEGLSHLQVAAALGISRSAVEKHVSSALRHLLKQS